MGKLGALVVLMSVATVIYLFKSQPDPEAINTLTSSSTLSNESIKTH
jgi:hypothetical protein